MLRFPANYNSISAKQSPSKDSTPRGGSQSARQLLAEESQPDDAKIKHSVLKSLWFPILTNLTNLIMEKRRDIQEKSLHVFFDKIFNEYSVDFTLDFWRDVLSQVILPMLEDIHLAVEIPNKK